MYDSYQGTGYLQKFGNTQRAKIPPARAVTAIASQEPTPVAAAIALLLFPPNELGVLVELEEVLLPDEEPALDDALELEIVLVPLTAANLM